ncbi:hypothetical protein HPP92_013691 [Vanilla planifolia]|uniref:rRNA-processing protein EFG1 n=1 Tax=Vanilla planifolia TaxID=51239 RepID=A0A835QW56_VANPL|nr:hypothetical protein HPP92_014140 [Vanilla planifolia]KAG0478972.1 hypothetical protein HPP92_013691 [Vanilla planifolia]
MARGSYARRRIEGSRKLCRHPKVLGVFKKKKKGKNASLKNQIRSTERFLRKDLTSEVRASQEQKLSELKKLQETQVRLAIERKMQLRDKKIKFFERRKIERMIRRLEKQQRVSSDNVVEEKTLKQLAKLREDLEYVRFFPKLEKYVPLFAGGDDPKCIDRRNRLRKLVKENLIFAAASGKDLEETASDDDVLDSSEDDFFSSGSSSEEAEADDEWTDRSTREPGSSASGKATSSMSSDERNKIPERVLMPPPRSLPLSRFRSGENVRLPSSSTVPNSRNRPISRQRSTNASADLNSNLSSNSDVHKPRRKRRPKKKKQISSV